MNPYRTLRHHMSTWRLPSCGWRCALAVGLTVVWLGVSGYYWNLLFAHTYRSAAVGAAVSTWPNDTPLPREAADLQVVLFAHPLCPCTRATLAELGEALARLPTKPAVSAVFVTAGLSPAAVAKSDTLASARRIPSVHIEIDGSGGLARQFGATISGEVLVFDRQGTRLYRGGLTAGRGHRGGSAALTLFEQILSGSAYQAVETPVFGCRLPAISK